jgi:glycosyltransferase involved in cell wall biosynthesis
MVNDYPKLTTLIAQKVLNDKTDLAIIIPTYNRPTELYKALNSLESLNSKRYKIEILVIDNASPDASVRGIIESYAASTKLDFSYYRNIKNLGANKSYNISVKLIRSENFLYLFDDDQLLPNFSKILDKLEIHTKEAFYFDHSVRYLSDTNTKKRQFRLFLEQMMYPFSLRSKRLSKASMLLTVPTFIGAIYNKDSFLKIGGIDESNGPTADYAFTIKYWLEYGIIKFKFKLVEYYHGNNASSKDEIFSLFAKANYIYRTHLLNVLDMTQIKRKYYRILIDNIYEFERQQRSLFNSIIYLMVYLLRKLNLL